ncbi:MAG: hypothetical protein ABI439_01935 [Rhodospirillales bacterium]
MSIGLIDALQADRAAPERGRHMELYGQFVGSWDLDVTRWLDDGTERKRQGEWHFGWVLEGRAIQDVWIVPKRGMRPGDAAAHQYAYGSTLRIYDPRIDAWRIQWTEPVLQAYLSMIGRADGNDIVQLGKDEHGNDARWSFRDITPNSFLWRGELSGDGGKTWRKVVEFTAQRVQQ